MQTILIFPFLTLWSLLENKSLQWQAHLELGLNISLLPCSSIGNLPGWHWGIAHFWLYCKVITFLERYSGNHSFDFLLSIWFCHYVIYLLCKDTILFCRKTPRQGFSRTGVHFSVMEMKSGSKHLWWAGWHVWC